jgi:rod shape-determining protein MreD
MNVFILCIVSYLVLAFQSPFMAELGLSTYAPDLSIGLLLAASTRLNPARLLVFALILGTLVDGFVPLSPLGLHMERLVILAYATRTLLNTVSIQTPGEQISYGIGMCLVSDFILFVLLALFDKSFHEYGLIFRQMIPHALVTGLSVPVVVWIVKGFWSLVGRKQDGIFYS